MVRLCANEASEDGMHGRKNESRTANVGATERTQPERLHDHALGGERGRWGEGRGSREKFDRVRQSATCTLKRMLSARIARHTGCPVNVAEAMFRPYCANSKKIFPSPSRFFHSIIILP